MRLSIIMSVVAIILVASVFIAPAVAQFAPLAPIAPIAPLGCGCGCAPPCWAGLLNLPFAGGMLGHSCGCPFDVWIYNALPCNGCGFLGAGRCGVVNDHIGAQTWAMAA
jgi:hypothetical protein